MSNDEDELSILKQWVSEDGKKDIKDYYNASSGVASYPEGRWHYTVSLCQR